MRKKKNCFSPRRGKLCRYIKTMDSAVKQTDRRQPAWCASISPDVRCSLSRC